MCIIFTDEHPICSCSQAKQRSLLANSFNAGAQVLRDFQALRIFQMETSCVLFSLMKMLPVPTQMLATSEKTSRIIHSVFGDQQFSDDHGNVNLS